MISTKSITLKNMAGIVSAMFFLSFSVSAQQFNQRFDPDNLLTPETAWNVELLDSSIFVCYGTWDTLPPNQPVTGSALFSASGAMIESSKYFEGLDTGHFFGWSNSGSKTTLGGLIIGGNNRWQLGAVNVSQGELYNFNNAGTLSWKYSYGDPNLRWIGRQARQDLDGGFLLVGDRRDQYPGTTQTVGFLIKTDSLGNYLWDCQFAISTNHDYPSVSVVPIGNSKYAIGGRERFSGGAGKPWVTCIDSTGAIHWNQLLNFNDDSPLAQINGTADGNIICASALSTTAPAMQQPYLLKLDTAGNTIWAHTYGPVLWGTTFFTVHEINPGGNLIACGVDQGSSSVQSGLLLRTNHLGDSLWMRTYTYADTLFGDGEGRFYDVVPMPDGGFTAAGATYFSDSLGFQPGYSQDVWLVRVDSLGCIVPGCDSTGVGITEQVTNLNDAITIYPNPVQANGTFSVEISLPQHYRGEKLRLTVLNSLTQQVAQFQPSNAVILSSSKETFETRFEIAAPNKPGLFFLHLTSGTKWLSGTKFIVE